MHVPLETSNIICLFVQYVIDTGSKIVAAQKTRGLNWPVRAYPYLLMRSALLQMSSLLKGNPPHPDPPAQPCTRWFRLNSSVICSAPV